MTQTKKVKKPKLKGKEKFHHLYNDMPIWKSLLIMAFPSMIIMLVNGAYMFSDSLLSINFAADSYEGVAKTHPGLEAGDFVRLFMNGGSPINMVMIAFSIMFAMGIATRVAINLGAKRHDRALNTIKTGMTVGMMISVVLIPVLIFSAKPWIASQYSSTVSGVVADNSFDYIWIIIASFPLVMFNNIISSLFRTEARNKEMMVAMIAPIFINLFMDWVLMGPAGMGVEGGAWATFISTAITTLILIVFIYRKKESMIVFKNMFTLRIQAVLLFGIFLVGITPFLRNMAQSITQTVNMNVITSVSSHVYAGQAASIMSLSQHDLAAGILEKAHFHNQVAGYWMQQDSKSIIQALNSPEFAQIKPSLEASAGFAIPNIAESVEANFMAKMITGVMPVFALFFPVMFSFVQAANPIASYNYGAKNHKRVRQTYLWTIVYATVAAVFIYFLASFILAGPLMHALKVSGPAFDRAMITIKIMMLALPMFGIGIGAMTIFGATDRLFQSLIASSMQGLIIFWPCIFGFKEIALHVDWEYAFWFYTPTSAFLTSVINTLMVLHTLKHLDRPGHVTIDERIEKVVNWSKNRKIKQTVKPTV